MRLIINSFFLSIGIHIALAIILTIFTLASSKIQQSHLVLSFTSDTKIVSNTNMTTGQSKSKRTKIKNSYNLKRANNSPHKNFNFENKEEEEKIGSIVGGGSIDGKFRNDYLYKIHGLVSKRFILSGLARKIIKDESVLIQLYIERSGSIKEISIIESSKNKMIENFTVATISKIKKLPHFPNDIKDENIILEIPIIFKRRI